MSFRSVPPPGTLVLRLPRSAYLAVLFLIFCVIPLAFAAGGDQGAPAALGPQTALVLIPIVAAIFIARTATVIDESGIRVRALLGSRRLAWNDIRGLSVTGRSVYAVCADGLVRLPCVRIAHLAAVARASGGRLPEMAEPRPKAAPSRRSRR